jgi:hypothetical protein
MQGLRRMTGLAMLFIVLIGGSEAFGAAATHAGAVGESSAVAQARSSEHVPPVPRCYKQPGACNGSYLKAGALPVRRVAPKASGIYTFGWKPLQFKKPVSCGADNEGCLYNSLTWIAGAGSVVSGCQPNDSSCTIKVAIGYGWLPVVVIQNSYPVAFFVVYSPPTEPAKEPAKATLEVTVSAADHSVDLGQTENVTAKVTAHGGEVSSISLGNGLRSSSAAAAITGSPPGSDDFSLANGASRTFEYKLKGLKAGSTTLAVSAAGASASGSTVRGSGSLKLEVGAYDLSGQIVETDCSASTCKKKPSPVAGVSVTASGTARGSAITGADGTYVMTLPRGSYTVAAHSGDRPFRPETQHVDLTGDADHVDFETCSVTEHSTMLRGSESASPPLAATATFAAQSPSLLNAVRVIYTGCAGNGRMMVGWVSNPECNIPGFHDPIETHGYGRPFPAQVLVGTPGHPVVLAGPFKVTHYAASIPVDGAPALTITIAADLESATVVVDGKQPALTKTGYPNQITANAATTMTCRPVSEKFTLPKKG